MITRTTTIGGGGDGIGLDQIGFADRYLPPSLAPYADYLYGTLALVLAVQATRNQAKVQAQTADYETFSEEEASAAEAAAARDGP